MGLTTMPRSRAIRGFGVQCHVPFLLPLLLFAFLLLSCQTLIPSPDREITPPPLSAYRRTRLAAGVELLEYQGPETRVSGKATYVSGSGGSVGFGITLPAGRKKENRPRIQAAAVIVDLTQAELVPVARPLFSRPGAARSKGVARGEGAAVDRGPARDRRPARDAGPARDRGGAGDRGPAGDEGPARDRRPAGASAGPDAAGEASAGALAALRPSLFLADHPELLAVINATPFDPNVLSVGEPVRPVGVVLLEGREFSGFNSEYAALYLSAAGRPWIALQPPWLAGGHAEARREVPGSREGSQGSGAEPTIGAESELSRPPGSSIGAPAGASAGAREVESALDGRELESALGGYFIVLSAGEVRGPRRFRAARSAIGISGDRRRVILLAVAGDSPGRSVGLTAAEVGLWLKSLGAEEGLLLDGGGSSSMAVRLPLGEARMTITPSWGPTLGVERPVATLLAVRAKKE